MILNKDILEFHNSYDFKEAIKVMQGRKWVAKNKIWTAPVNLDNLNSLYGILGKLPSDLEEVRGKLREKDNKTMQIKQAEIVQPIEPMPIKVKPFMHQIKGYNLAMMHGNAGLLMEMGCGKTLSSIAIAGRRYLNGDVKRVLIVAPSSVVPVWPREFDDYADFAYECKALTGSSTERAKQIKQFDTKSLQVAVVNYEATWRMIDDLAAWNPDMIICDESQRIKNNSAKQSKALHKLGDKAKYKLILSGTPVTQAPLDFWSQYRFLDKTIFGTSYYAFKARYAVLGGFQGRQVVAYNHLDELTRKAHSIAFRVTKAEALDLPEQVDETRICELEPAAMKVYKQVKSECLAEFEAEKDSITAPNVLTRLLRLSQITGGFVNTDEGKVKEISNAKLSALQDIIEDLQDAGKKVVVFCRFTAEINAIRRHLEKEKIGYSYIDGSVTDRGEQVKRFQTEPDCKVFIGQIDTAGAGITLTAADTAVFYSIGYNYASYEQARARIHRIGQKNNCTYIHLICEKTVDELILQALKTKGNMAKMVVDDWRKFFK